MTSDNIFRERGELAELIRGRDWSQTPLGAPETWPTSLRTVLRLMLASRYAMWMGWGPELAFFYNDAYREQTLGAKHPWALGRPASEVWAEIWDTIRPRIEHVIATGEATWDQGLLLFLERSGYPEETYHTFSYSPLPGEGDRAAAGMFCVVVEETERVIGERRLALLREFAALLSQTKTTAEVLDATQRTLAADARDVPFSLVYFFDPDGRHARLAAASGLGPDHPAAPDVVALDALECPWRLRDVLTLSVPAVVALSPDQTWPRGAWRVPPASALVVPIAQQGQREPAGAFVAAINPHRPLDEAMSSFVGLFVGQFAAGLSNARAYEEEKRRAEALAEIDRAKTAFFSNVSHEFRTPLTLMLGPTEDALASPERALRGADLEAVHRNELRLLKLVNALLDFSRIEAGRAQAAYEPTDLAALTADLASAFRSAVERAGLRFDVACDLPPEPVFVDHAMWEKIVLNLLSNALKFTFEGAITVTLRAVGGRVELAVADTGIGIAAPELGHLFERFHRVEGARSRTHEGSGIGLALVHELARLHGGDVRVDSEPGRGTTFTVSVPRGRAHLPPEHLRVPSPGASTGAGAASFVAEALRWLVDDPAQAEGGASASPAEGGERAARVLVADDNADMREYLSRLLSRRWSVEAVADGVAALAAARRRPPDLILTDVMMPHLDGFGLLRALRADPATEGVPVVMLSARAGDEARSEGIEAGADDYLVKPFSERELVARVSTRLQIAERRRVAEAERARLYALFDQAPVAIAVLAGPALRFAVANAAYCEITGRDRAIVGLAWVEAFPELVGTPVHQGLLDAYQRGETATYNEAEIRLRRHGGVTPGYFNYVVQPMREEGRVFGLMVVATDVSEQVRARRRVDGLRAAAEDASRAKDEFLNTLSHELRTPLNAIIGWSTLLRNGSVPEAQRPKALETVERNARIQARLIEDMLDLSRIEQGKFVLSVGPVEMVRVVEAATEAVRPAAEAKGIRIQAVLDSHAAIVGDADRLQQVVWNLLSNAIKFTPRGGRVQVRLRREQSHVELVVADNGQGIAADFLPHVFDRFRQGDASFTRRAGGLGLGLAIVRSLVELHGGDARAESDGADAGATFTVRLPLAPLRADRVSPVAAEPGAPKRAAFECPPALRGKRVLIVDDEPETRELLRYVIAQCDCEVETAGSGPDALSALERNTYDVLISDVGMPEMDGFELVRRLRALPASANGRLPALALTAYARVEDRTRALREGFDMHLAKPIEPGELLAVLGTLVSDRRRG